MQGATDATQSQEESKALTEETAKQLKVKIETYLKGQQGGSKDYAQIASLTIALLDSEHFPAPMKHRMIYAIYNGLQPELGLAEALKLPMLVENDTAIITKTDKALRADMQTLAKKLKKKDELVAWVSLVLERFSKEQFMPIGQSLGKKTGVELLHFVTLLAREFAAEPGPVREEFKAFVRKYNEIFAKMDLPSAKNSKESSAAATPIRKQSDELPVGEVKEEERKQEEQKQEEQKQEEEAPLPVELEKYNNLLNAFTLAKNGAVITRCEMGIQHFDNTLSAMAGHKVMSDESKRNPVVAKNPTVKIQTAFFNEKMEVLRIRAVALLAKMSESEDVDSQKSLLDEIVKFDVDLKSLKGELTVYLQKTKFGRMNSASKSYLAACKTALSVLRDVIGKAMAHDIRNKLEIAALTLTAELPGGARTPASQSGRMQLEQVESPIGLSPGPVQNGFAEGGDSDASLYPANKGSKTDSPISARLSESLSSRALLLIGAVLMAPLPTNPSSGFDAFISKVVNASTYAAQFELIEKAGEFKVHIDDMMDAHCKEFMQAVVDQEELVREGAGQDFVDDVLKPAGGSLYGLERVIHQAEVVLNFWELKNSGESYTSLLKHDRFTAKLHAQSKPRSTDGAHKNKLKAMLGESATFPEKRARIIMEFKKVVQAAARQIKLSAGDLAILMKVSGAEEKILNKVETELALYNLIDKGFEKMFASQDKLGFFFGGSTVSAKSARLAGAIHGNLSRGANAMFAVPEGEFSTESFKVLPKALAPVADERNGLTA